MQKVQKMSKVYAEVARAHCPPPSLVQRALQVDFGLNIQTEANADCLFVWKWRVDWKSLTSRSKVDFDFDF